MAVHWDEFESKRGATPVYRQLAGWIAKRIADGSLEPGDQIPAERRFAEMTGLSVDTVRSAMGALCEAGLVETGHGTGTFVV